MNIDFIGQLGGTASAVAVDDSHVYAGFGMEFAVLAPSPSLHRVGYTLLPNTVQKIVLDGTYAYVLADGALNIVDIADPQRPTPVIDEYPRMATDSAALASGGLAVRDRRAYLRSGADFYIIDVQDSRHPVTLYETHNVSLGETFIDAQGNFMHRTFGCQELEVWDISQPSSPTVVAHLPQEEGHRCGCYVSGFVVEGDYAYIGSPYMFWISLIPPSPNPLAPLR